MAEHTQLPWRAAKGGYLMAPDGNREVQVAKIGSFHDKEIAPFTKGRWQADLDLIVKAVNSHDALVKALEEITRGPECLSRGIAAEALRAVVGQMKDR